MWCGVLGMLRRKNKNWSCAKTIFQFRSSSIKMKFVFSLISLKRTKSHYSCSRQFPGFRYHKRTQGQNSIFGKFSTPGKIAREERIGHPAFCVTPADFRSVIMGVSPSSLRRCYYCLASLTIERLAPLPPHSLMIIRHWLSLSFANNFFIEIKKI